MNLNIMSGWFGLLVMLGISEATLSKSDKKKERPNEIKLSSVNVIDRGLVTEKVKSTDIIKEHASYCDRDREVKHFPGVTLAYVTPWNSHGYDIAKTFSRKFSFVSPVWLQIKRRKGGTFYIQGDHDIDQGRYIQGDHDIDQGRCIQGTMTLIRVGVDKGTMTLIRGRYIQRDHDIDQGRCRQGDHDIDQGRCIQGDHDIDQGRCIQGDHDIDQGRCIQGDHDIDQGRCRQGDHDIDQ
ncbi:chitinase domain-containing protein 1-like, partial [Saccostrea cucullata]|uniref:chitinase domain-containing protein 1-like n=1 Tax=Saccostrea cuccullata TaxID=36930 RepID=UPI002ED178DF